MYKKEEKKGREEKKENREDSIQLSCRYSLNNNTHSHPHTPHTHIYRVSAWLESHVSE